MMRFIVQFLLSLSLVLACFGQTLGKEPVRMDAARSQSALHPSAGLLLNTSPGGHLRPWCTVSLISPDLALSAYHCVTSTHTDDELKVFFPYEGLRDVLSSEIKPFCKVKDEQGSSYDSEVCSPSAGDLVVLKLSSPYLYLQPTRIGDKSSLVKVDRVHIEGFGIHTAKLDEYGVKHCGDVYLSECGDPGQSGIEDKSYLREGSEICFLFDETDKAQTRIGPFDSGGPMFLTRQDSDERTLVGVAIGTQRYEGKGDDLRKAKYLNLTYPPYRRWLVSQLPAGEIIPSSNLLDVLQVDSVRYLKPGSEDNFLLEIHKWSTSVLITLNHAPGPEMFPNDLMLIVPDDLSPICERHATLEVCLLKKRGPGSLLISVGHGKSCGEDGICSDSLYKTAYQLTAVAIYDTPIGQTAPTDAVQD